VKDILKRLEPSKLSLYNFGIITGIVTIASYFLKLCIRDATGKECYSLLISYVGALSFNFESLVILSRIAIIVVFIYLISLILAKVELKIYSQIKK